MAYEITFVHNAMTFVCFNFLLPRTFEYDSIVHEYSPDLGPIKMGLKIYKNGDINITIVV